MGKYDLLTTERRDLLAAAVTAPKSKKGAAWAEIWASVENPYKHRGLGEQIKAWFAQQKINDAYTSLSNSDRTWYADDCRQCGLPEGERHDEMDDHHLHRLENHGEPVCGYLYYAKDDRQETVECNNNEHDHRTLRHAFSRRTVDRSDGSA